MPNSASPRPQVLPGTLDLMVLSMLDRSPCHAYELARRITAVTGRVVAIEEGSLFPCLKRLESGGFLVRQAGIGPTGRRIRNCKLTVTGRRELRRQISLWRDACRAVEAVLALPAAGDLGDYL
jgi:PadR family transcriptional regulator PadR